MIIGGISDVVDGCVRTGSGSCTSDASVVDLTSTSAISEIIV